MKQKKRLYERPRVEVYELRQQPQLLAGSGDGGFGGDPIYEPLP